jgi:hypothetical protein
MDVARRLRFGLAALVALAASAFFAAPALADTQPDPQLTNQPYLAWRGEEVRLVKCDPDILAGLDQAQRNVVAQSAQFEDIFVDFLLVDWSGDPNVVKPQLEPGTVSMFFRSFDGEPCVAATVVSEKAGMAQFKLVVTANISLAAGTPFINVPEVITIKHDFNVAWMNIHTATLSVTSGGTTDVAGGSGNELQVLVNGTIPLLSNYGELGLGDSITMPDDWAPLANAMATFRDPLEPNPAMHWDNHDEFSPGGTGAGLESHGAQSACTHNTTAFVDTVDDCGNLDPFGPFSRVWQNFTNPTFGPFDPQRPQQTLLSNGTLDEGDAPMPAARVDWAIAQNSGAPGDISGVGSLFPQLKFLTYVRNTDHPYYAPFYAFWLPPTYPALASAFFGEVPPFFVNEASGVTGPVNLSRSTSDCAGSVLINGIPTGGGNDFNGFLACGLYLPWLFAKNLQCGPGGTLVDPNDPFGDCAPASPATGCLPVVAGSFTEPETGADIPFLDQKSVAYTDEHGEARVLFLPGTQFFFTNLPGVSINSNGGCDLGGVTTLGTANVSATIRYPFEPVTARPVVSNTVTKTVTSAFSKSITCYPKGSQPVEQEAAICVAEAHDITGAPFVGETVCFSTNLNAESKQYFAGAIAGTNIVIGDEGRNAAAEANAQGQICPFTDSNGRAAIEVFNSDATSVDVIALFVDEGILRSLHVQFPITAQVGPSTGAAKINQTPTPVQTGTKTPDTSKPAATVKITSVKLVRQSRTRATLIVKVSGPAGKVPLRTRFGATGKKAISSIHMVKTNKLVRLRGLRTPNAKRLVMKVSLVS